MPTTTIEITETQKDWLDDFKKVPGESYKSALGWLMESHSGDAGGAMGDHSDDELAERIDRLQELVEQAPERTADELEGRLR